MGPSGLKRLIDSCITQPKDQGPSRTCIESKEEEEEEVAGAVRSIESLLKCRCRANMAHIRQPRHDSALDLTVKVFPLHSREQWGGGHARILSRKTVPFV